MKRTLRHAVLVLMCLPGVPALGGAEPVSSADLCCRETLFITGGSIVFSATDSSLWKLIGSGTSGTGWSVNFLNDDFFGTFDCVLAPCFPGDAVSTIPRGGGVSGPSEHRPGQFTIQGQDVVGQIDLDDLSGVVRTNLPPAEGAFSLTNRLNYRAAC